MTPAHSADGGGANALRWSVFTVGDNLPDRGRRVDRHREILDYVEEAERLGYWGFFFAEHHFHAHGEVPDPWLLVAAAAERTRGGRIRLGPMVSNLSFRNPVRLAEQALLANRLSQDRIEIGVGSGNVLREHVTFGLVPEPPARKREAFQKALPVFVAAVEGSPVPAPGLPADSVRIPIDPIRPLGQRLWAAVGQADAGIRFGLAGHSIALGPPFATMRSLSELTAAVGAIRAAVGGGPPPRFAAAFPAYVGDDPAEGFEALERFLEQKHEDGTGHLETGQRPARSGHSAEGLVRANLAIVGNPEDARRQVAEIAATGITDLLVIPDFGGIAPSAVLGTLRHLAPAPAGAPGSAPLLLRSSAPSAT